MSLYSTTSDFLKDVWAPTLSYQLERSKGTAYGMVEKQGASDVRFEGRKMYLKLRIGDSKGQEMIGQGGDYPTPYDPDYDEAELELAHFAHSTSWDTDELAKADSDRAAAAPILREKMEAARATMERELVRQFWMDGSGKIANVSSATGTYLVLDETTTSQIDRDRYIWLDDGYRRRYSTVHATTGVAATTDFLVTEIEEGNGTVHCGTTMTDSDSADVLVHKGDWATGGAFRSLEMDGIMSMVTDDNTYLTLDRTASGFSWWKSVVDDNSGTLRPISENLIHQILHKVARRGETGAQPGQSDDGYKAFSNFGPWTAYHNLMSPGLRYVTDKAPDIGWSQPLNLLGVPFYKDIFAPQNNIFILHIPSIFMVKPAHNGYDNLLKFRELGGSVFFQANASSGQGHAAKVFSYLEGFCGLATKRPRNHGRLDDITGVAEAY